MIKIESSALSTGNKNVVFMENHLPGLESGDYSLSVTQTTAGTGEGGHSVSDHFTTTQKFSVLGERWVLGTDRVYSVFPAENHKGDFSNTLAHVVFPAASFPWQRDVGAKASALPWLGVLAFGATEAPKLKQVTLGTFKTASLPAGTAPEQMIFYNFTKETGDHDDAPCQVVDIPVALFNALAPSLEELKYLAHVREVDTTNKAVPLAHHRGFVLQNTPASSQATFSVVVGNRLFRTPDQYRTHLLSFENMGSYLPDSSGKASDQIGAGKTHIRLVSLYHWSFTVVPESRHLSDIIQALDRSPIALRVPAISGSKAGVGEANQALGMGYMPLEHHLRSGGKTVSWYRGPLAPYHVRENIISWPRQSADAQTRYNPDGAMFDLSYGAAWQLGRLLGLKNKKFAQSLYQWKSQNTQATIRELEQQVLAGLLGLEREKEEGEVSLAEGLVTDKAILRAVKRLLQASHNTQ